MRNENRYTTQQTEGWQALDLLQFGQNQTLFQFMFMGDTQSLKKAESNSLFIAHTTKVQDVAELVLKARHSSKTHVYNIGLFVIGEERNRHKSASYHGMFDYVLRNYYFENLNSGSAIDVQALGNLTCGTAFRFPVREEIEAPSYWHKRKRYKMMSRDARLGTFWLTVAPLYRIPAPSSLLPASERRFSWCFLGSLRQDRKAMRIAFTNAFPDVIGRLRSIRRNSSSGVEGMLSVSLKFKGDVREFGYSKFGLSNCAISLTPQGNNPETIRFADSLSVGSVPLSIRSQVQYFTSKFYSQPPMLLAEDWDDALSVVNRYSLASERNKLDTIQKDAVEWYQNLLRCQTSDFARIIEMAIEPPSLDE